MALLPDEIKAQVREPFADLKNPVRLVIFTQTLECAICQQNRELLEEVAEQSDQVTAEVYEPLRHNPSAIASVAISA